MGIDKWLHLMVGFIIFFVITSLFNNPESGVLTATAAGAWKEVLDSIGSGTPEFTDFFATFMGGILGYLYYLLLGESGK